MDLIESYGQLVFNLDFYTEVQDLSRLVGEMGGDRFGKRFRKLSSGLCEVCWPRTRGSQEGRPDSCARLMGICGMAPYCSLVRVTL